MGLWTRNTARRFGAATVLRAFLGLSGLAAITAPFAGCASEREPVTRVAPYALRKSMFVRPDADGGYRKQSDTWYFRATITDVPASNSVAFVGAAGEMFRIKWEVEESMLIARREDPDVLGTEDKTRGIVAAFPITSHFDIRRDYNSATGEESNVIVENTTDRPWYAREYMRVDWSSNQLSAKGFVFPGIEDISAASYWVQNANDKDAPLFQDGYVDMTARYTIVPTGLSCFYLYHEQLDGVCGPADVTMRVAFMKVPDRDFMPREYPDRIPVLDKNGDPVRAASGQPITLPVMEQFGFFRTERAVYDQRFGTLEKRYLYRANTWNIWDTWFQRDDKGNVQYEAGSDGQPDKSKPKLLPYSQRKIRPIVYFLNPEFPNELKDTAKSIGSDWNDTFQETVASLRLLEKKAGGAVGTAEVKAEVDAMKGRNEDVFVVCPNNPVKDGDPKACGQAGTIARVGDLRYSFLYWVNKPQPSGPLGFGPSYADPITGQIFSASAFIYGAALDTYAQWGLDVIELLTGRVTTYEALSGQLADLYARRLAAGEVPGPSGSAADGLPALPGAADFDLAKTKAGVDRSIDRPLLSTIAAKGLPLAIGPSGIDRLAQIKGKPLARMLFDNPEMRALIGRTAEGTLSDEELDKITSVFLSKDLRVAEQEKLLHFAKNGCYYAGEFADDAILGVAKELAAKFPGADAPTTEIEKARRDAWMELRKRILRGVALHEVGHTVGLRHNFEGSSDALNYFDDYWKIRTADGKTIPKFGDAVTDEMKDKKLYEYEMTSIMDYGSRFNSDFGGLGKYDKAAVRFGYGNVVESWPAGKIKDPLYKADPAQIKGLTAGYSADSLNYINRNFRHYTQLPGEFSDGIASILQSGRELRRYDDVVAAARELYTTAAGSGKQSLVKTGSWTGSDAKAIDVVPYRYCGDEWAGTTNRPLCERWDRGADPFEVVKDTMDRYKSYYLFDAFARGRASGFNLARGYLSKIYTRYFTRVSEQYVPWLYYQGERSKQWATLGDTGVKNGFIGDIDWFKDPGGGLPATLATTYGFDRLVDAIGSSDPGYYRRLGFSDGITRMYQIKGLYGCGTAPTLKRCDSDASNLAFDIADGARLRYTQYEGSLGSTYYLRIRNIGSFYDRVAALLAFTNTTQTLVGEDQTDQLKYRIGPYLAYPKVLSTVFGGLSADRDDLYGWRYDGVDSKTKSAKLLSPDLFRATGGSDGIPKPDALKGTPIETGWYFFYRGYALYFAMAQFQANYSQSFNDAVRVWVVGSGEGFTPGPDSVLIKVDDPLSGKTYAALDYGDGRYSPGAELIRTGQRFAKDYADATARPPDDPDRNVAVANATGNLANHIQFLDLVRGLYAEYGSTKL